MSLQDMNVTLAELKLEKDHPVPSDQSDNQPPPLNPPLPSDTSGLWEAIDRLDDMVVNNTVKVGSYKIQSLPHLKNDPDYGYSTLSQIYKTF